MKKRSKSILVTGAAGFIGSGVVAHLNEQGINNLVLVDNLGKTEKWKNLVGKQFRELLHKEDLFSWLSGKEKEIEAIIHLGACSDTLETNADYLLENNTRYTIRLAEIALQEGIRFIYASSAATYGDGLLGFSDSHDLLSKYRPLNMYGYSKHLVDLWLKDQGALDKVVGLKYFNVYGPNEFHKGRMASAVVKMLPDAQEKGVIRLFKSSEPERFGDGEQVRDFIYVKDAAPMTTQFLTNDKTGIYNIGTGMTFTWNQLARAVEKALNKPISVQYCEMPPELIGKYQNYTCADMRKYREQGLLQARYSLEDAVKDYVQNYLINRHYW